MIEKTGEIKGIRDNGALEASLSRPYATFEDIDLYPTTIDKAAALLESVIINRPFIDGNNRTVLMKYILFKEGISIKK